MNRKTLTRLLMAPVNGIAFVIFLPFAGFVVLAAALFLKMKTLYADWRRRLPKNV